jgi:hypothetical protein
MVWVKRGLSQLPTLFPALEILPLEKLLFLVGWLRVMGMG